MKNPHFTIVLLIALLTAPLFADRSNKKLDIYWCDVEGGAATLIVTPAGESILIDTGMPGERDPARIKKLVTETAGLEKIDILVVTHFDIDHFGGTADLSRLIPIGKVYDPGLPDRKNLSDRNARLLTAYIEATKNKRSTMKPADRLSLKQASSTPALRITCLAAQQEFISPSPDYPPNKNICSTYEPKKKDLSQNANSIVLLLKFGNFDFLDAADLTWNLEHRLVCPVNLVGSVDVFQVDHHGLDQSNNPVLIRTIGPTVAVMNNGHRKGCQPNTFKTLKNTPSIRALYQMHRNVTVGPEGNTHPDYIVNYEEKCTAETLKLSVAPDGKSYRMTIAATGHSAHYHSR